MSETSHSQTGSRRQVSSLSSLFVLSTSMFEARNAEEILSLSMNSVSSLGPIAVDAAYLIDGEQRSTITPDGVDVGDLIDQLDGQEGPLDLAGRAWGWAYPLRTQAGLHGYLVLGGAADPEPDVLFLVKVLVQQTAMALANALLYHAALAIAADLRSVSDESARINRELTGSMDELARRARVHEVLAQASARQGGEGRIAAALSQLIALPVATEDQFGNVTAWSAPDGSEPYRKQPPAEHDAILHDASKAGGGPMRFGSRLVEVVRRGQETLGAVVAVDHQRAAGDYERFAMQQAATALAIEWGHQRELAEIKLRLRRELVDELISGTAGDIADTYARASAIGHDLTGPHQVVTVRWSGAADTAVTRAAEHALAHPGLRPLLARRSGLLVVIAPYPVNARALHRTMARELTASGGSIGVSASAADPRELPRAYAESVRALEIRANSRTPSGVSDYTELGIYRLLGTGDTTREVEAFVQQWLGPLLDYDARRHSELVHTLATYLDCGGNYDQTADRLMIHRSTLRYRLHRIRDLAGRDLSDVDTRFNLHVATRAWAVLDGL